jgi:iron complex transport system substrate-binding protein
MKRLALAMFSLGVALVLMTACTPTPELIPTPTPTPTPLHTSTPIPTPTPTPTPIPNNPPEITSLKAYPSSVDPGGTSTITCIASDPDNDTITYTWSATGGTISGLGNIVTWIAPTATGNFIISATAADSIAGTDTRSCYIAVSTQPGPITVTDDLGRTVKVEGIPQRIVSLSPSNTEILFALDLGNKVVGVTDFCDYPEELLAKIDTGKIQRVGAPWPGFSLETIVSLDPDLAFAVGETVPDYVDDLEGLGIPVVILQPHDIADIFTDVELAGEITGKEAEAGQLVDEMEAHLVSTCTITASANTTPTVFYELDAFNPASPWTAGSGTFVDILIALAAGENIASTVEGWTTFGLEDLITADPDMIILGDYPWVAPEDVVIREGWETLSAVQNGSIYPINVDLVSRPGPRIFDGLEELANIIHPELFE